MNIEANYDSTTGTILAFYPDDVPYPNGIPSPTIEITYSQWQDAVSHPGKYIVQNGQLVEVIIPDETQFENAKNNKVIEIEIGYAQTIASGFQFTIGSSTYTMGWRQDGIYNDQLHLDMTQSAVNDGIEQFPVPYADINGNGVSIPDQPTLTALCSKANAFSWNQLKQWRTLSANVKAHKLSDYATLQEGLDAINSITWTPATY